MPTYCLVLNYSNNKCKRKDLSFCRIPKIITNQGKEMEILSTERRRRWLSAISRENLSEEILQSNRICGEHFHSGKAAPLWDRFNVDWVPSLNLGHQNSTKDKASQQQDQDRAHRIVERRKRQLKKEVEETFEAKLRKLNKPGEAVKDLLDASGIEMVDIEDISENLPENLQNVCTQTNMAAQAVHTQTDETHNTILTPEPSFSQVWRFF